MRGSLLAGALLLAAAPAAANVEVRSPLAAYVQARAAATAGADAEAMRRFAAALSLAPDNELLAARALSEAIAAGDRPLALRAARLLDAGGTLQTEGRLLLFGEALRTRAWREAGRQIEALEKEEIFSFTAPLLRAWLAQASGKGNPLALLAPAAANPLGKAYAAEHRALLLLASGKVEAGAAALAAVAGEETVRGQRLRIAAAAGLARKRDRSAALALLDGEAPALRAARRRLEAGKAPGPEIASAPAGVGELLLAISLDLNAQEVQPLALAFARVAAFLDPENAAARLVAAEILAAQRRHPAAIAALAEIGADDPFAGGAAERRMAFLLASERAEEALVQARAATEAEPALPDHWTRLGDVLTDLTRHGEAAEAYGKALELAKAGAEASQPLWGLWLLRGSALTQAGRWPEGKAALEEAHRLSPNQAVVLNYLGYSQLERRENLAEATRLIAEASKLQPDDPAITDSLGWAHYVRGELGPAIRLLEQAAQGQPADAAINEHLGDAYYAAGRRFEARYAWQAALAYAEGAAAARLRAKIEAGLRPELAAP